MKKRSSGGSSRKPRVVRQRKAPSPRKRKKAISLLAKWARSDARVEFIGSSGLRHPGTLGELGSSPDKQEFLFIADSGANLPIFPSLWTKVEAEMWEFSESVHIVEYAREYSIVLSWKPKHDDENDAAKAQLKLWFKLKAGGLYIAIEGFAFPGMSFHGSVEVIDEETYVLTQKNTEFFFVISMKNAHCEVSKRGDHVMVHIVDRAKRCSIVVSETALSATDLARRFSRMGSFVN